MFYRKNQIICFFTFLLFSMQIFILPPLWAESGTEKWNIQKGTNIKSCPAITGDGTIYFGSDDNNLYALNSDGTEKWVFSTGDDILSSPCIGADNTIYIGSNDNNLYAVNPDGTEKWHFQTGDNIVSSPCVGTDGTIYTGSDDNNLYAINSDGRQKWRFQTGDIIRTNPAVSNLSVVYIGSDDGFIYAFNTEDGLEKWRFQTGGSIRSSPAIGSDNIIYIGSDDNYLYALNTDGTIKWQFKTGGPIQSSPIIDSGSTIYTCSDDNYIYALTSGQDSASEKWKFLTSAQIKSTPVIGSGSTIFFASGEILYALDSGGNEKWNLYINKTESSPVIAYDKTLYVGSGTSADSQGVLYAVETDSRGINTDAFWPMISHDVRHTSRNSSNIEPVADAGEDQNVIAGEKVTLDASGASDPDYGIASYAWTQTAGETVTLSDSDTLWPSFTASTPEKDEDTLTFELTITDNGGLKSTDTVNIIVEEDDNFCFIKTSFY